MKRYLIRSDVYSFTSTRKRKNEEIVEPTENIFRKKEERESEIGTKMWTEAQWDHWDGTHI